MTAVGVKAGSVGAAGSEPPKRISFNFTDRCNMACAFCYIPFDGERVEESRAGQVIDLIMRWSPSSITVGGGDPLMYPSVSRLLRRIRDGAVGRRPFVQLDSNLIHLPRHDVAELTGLVDMLGVPVDSFDPRIALQMRRDVSHLGQVRELVPQLVAMGVCIKLNTVVAPLNLACLPGLATFVADSGIPMWSLYEFWAIGSAARRNHQMFTVDHEQFLAAAKDATARAARARVEIGTVSSRASAYFFVTPTGRAYTVDSLDASRYAELGNVLEDEAGVLRRWHSHADATTNENRVRSRAALAQHRAPAFTPTSTPAHPRI